MRGVSSVKSAKWGIVLCIQCDSHREHRVDSQALDVAFQNTFEWQGTLTNPVVAMDGFQVFGSTLHFMIRVQPISSMGGERIAVAQTSYPASHLGYGAMSPRAPVTGLVQYGTSASKGSRRHSVHRDDLVPPADEYNVLEWKEAGLSLHYYAAQYHEQGTCVGQISVIDATYCPKRALRALMTQPGHKITCLLQSMHKGVRSRPRLYLGRAQRIQTNGTSRVYTWMTASSPRTASRVAHYTEDLRLIDCQAQAVHKRVAQLSAHNQNRRTFEALVYVPDNDELGNVVRKLPAVQTYEERMHVTFYNFKAAPPYGPSSASVELVWTDYVSAYKRTVSLGLPEDVIVLERPLSVPHANVCITFSMSDDYTQVCIRAIALRASDFEQTLLF